MSEDYCNCKSCGEDEDTTQHTEDDCELKQCNCCGEVTYLHGRDRYKI